MASFEDPITSPGSTVGTVAYLSPEQARGVPLDARTDNFSFGVVLYELTTGQLPFAGTTSAVVFEALLDKSPLPPSHLNPALPPELDRIISKTLEKDRDLQYQSARDLLVDLRNLKRDSAPGLAATSSKHSSRRRWWVSTAAGCLLAGACIVGYYCSVRIGPIGSLAVLPPSNSSSDPEVEFLGEGISESLINRLSQTPNLCATA